jgi:uncharacterized membrane protein YkvA (DUF1232 family)
MGLLMLFARSPRLIVQAYRLLRHPGVPSRLKLMTAAGAALILSPIDLFGDIPVLGLFSDSVLLALLLAWFVRMGTRSIEAGPPVDVTPPRAEASRQSVLVSRAPTAR